MPVLTARRVSIPIENRGRTASKTVLLVTNDGTLRGATTRALEGAGFDVVAVAHSGHALLAALTAGHIDVLASDLAMDDLSGPELAARLRRHHPALQTLFFANVGTPERQGIVVRPFTHGDLLDAISTNV